MSMCTGRSRGSKGECLREVPEGSLIQLCDIHLVLAAQEVKERGGLRILLDRVRASVR